MNISIIGLGKLGLPMAAAYASMGHQVTGIDVDVQKIAALKTRGALLFQESGLAAFLTTYRQNLFFTTNYGSLAETDITFILTQTPSLHEGAFSLRYIKEVCEQVALCIRDKMAYHLIVIASTVSPGACHGEVLPLLETVSGKVGGRDFGLCYSPELVALGSVVQDFLDPPFFIVGASDSRAGDTLEAFYETIANREVVRTNLVNAEIAKITLNCFLTTKISFANTIGELCERIPTANAHEVMSIVGKDPRISAKFLRPGCGYGGYCFPRDNHAFLALAEKYRTPAWLQSATEQVNQYQLNRFIRQIQQHLGCSGMIALLGLSYKPDTPSIEESMGVALAERLLHLGFTVRVYDPMALENVHSKFGERLHYTETMHECIHKAELVMICTPWPQFAQLRNPLVKKGVPILDPWGML